MTVSVPDFSFFSTKTYTHAHGLSCAFRQWRAKSHCSQLHGYSLQVKVVFEGQYLDENNWVVDFGGLKELKKWLEDMYDHKLLVAADDPAFNVLTELGTLGVAQVRTVQATGVEAFAAEIADWVISWTARFNNRIRLHSVEVSEHPGNSALVQRIP
jgi:6-pyruvoyltetrahydropterin/6-carboxytetrahydropterin synthase